MFKKLKEWFKREPDPWETIYTAQGTCEVDSLLHGRWEADAVVTIQLKRKCRAARGQAFTAATGVQDYPIFAICAADPKAAEICRKENITW